MGISICILQAGTNVSDSQGDEEEREKGEEERGKRGERRAGGGERDGDGPFLRVLLPLLALTE